VVTRNTPPSPESLAKPRSAAFSLVEVVLAVGVISFAFVAILGLLPAGLTQFRQAMDNSVGAQIAQRVILECQQTDFDTLTNTTATTTPVAGYYFPLAINGKTFRCFDEQGNEIAIAGTWPTPQEMSGTSASGSVTAGGTLGVQYFVVTRIGTSTRLAESSSAGTDSTNQPAGYSFGTATVTVQVIFNPSGRMITLNPYTQFDNTSCLVDLVNSHLPLGTVKTYSAQVGRND
jgi:hypothetical protein